MIKPRRSSRRGVPANFRYGLLLSYWRVRRVLPQQQNAAVELAHKILRPNVDRTFVISARGDKPWPNARQEWRSDADSLEKEVHGLDKDAGFADPFSFDTTTEDAGVSRHFTLLQYEQVGGSGGTRKRTFLMLFPRLQTTSIHSSRLPIRCILSLEPDRNIC